MAEAAALSFTGHHSDFFFFQSLAHTGFFSVPQKFQALYDLQVLEHAVPSA